ncbi:type II toxin-antitoxin system PrlF family antitoxin [Salinarimonas ramus]|uniref:SpoVT-AbrB domain-containing protein n=1 Tax=Salinarimonas ramus TaxID=690164 RepID=A0A917V3C0_9HYPH|nr:type II toxin-antitoxin system PrlF family antitoxin [Salinarimonas ramus]GGK29128.1 hypothetical protein GCM10011322_14440 [Salinarimonas ramus]
MSALKEETSKLTDRYQTTVPSGVRRQLDLRKGDQIRYCVEPTGRVYIEAVRDEEVDPALGAFLDLLEADIAAHPERLRPLSRQWMDETAAMVEGIEVDLDAPLDPEDG